MSVDLGRLAKRIVETGDLLRQWQQITGASDDEMKALRSELFRVAAETGVPLPTLVRKRVEEAAAGSGE